MAGYPVGALKEAHRASSSTLMKSEEAQMQLQEGTFQYRTTTKGIDAYRIAIELINREVDGMDDHPSQCAYTNDALSDALKAIASANVRVEKILPKFAPGTPQHTLAVRRIRAFDIATELIGIEMAGQRQEGESLL